MVASRSSISTWIALLGIILVPACTEVSLGAEGASAAEASSAIKIELSARRPAWAASERIFIDAQITNGSKEPKRLPYLFHCLIEVNGRLYTQFPKPIMENGGLFDLKAGATMPLYSVVLNDKARPVLDAKSGRVPLALPPGEYKVAVVLQGIRSNMVKVSVVQ